MMLSVMLLYMLMILLSKCDQASDPLQRLELTSELESDLWDRFKQVFSILAEKVGKE